MGYVESSLSPGEEIVFRASQHWLFFWRRILLIGLCAALMVAALVVKARTSEDPSAATLAGSVIAIALNAVVVGSLSTWTVCLALIALRRLRLEYAVTTKRVVIKKGLVWRNTLEISLQKVESVMVEQGVLGRLLGFGDIVIKGSGGTIEPFRCVVDPLGFRSAVESSRAPR